MTAPLIGPRPHLTAADVRAHLDYDPTTGEFKWRTGRRGRINPGDLAGYYNQQGYLMITLNDVGYRAHRLAWLLSTDEWPSDTIDHINGDKADNRICNLRKATIKQNILNRGPRPSAVGLKGVSITRSGKFAAKVMRDGKSRWLGVFETAEDAHVAYINGARKLHGEFARFA